jgi:hypothetical protein
LRAPGTHIRRKQCPRVIADLARDGREALMQDEKLGKYSEEALRGRWTLSTDVLTATGGVKLSNAVLVRPGSEWLPARELSACCLLILLSLRPPAAELFWDARYHEDESMTAGVVSGDVSHFLNDIGSRNVFGVTTDRGGTNDSAGDINVRTIVQRAHPHLYWIYDTSHFINNCCECSRIARDAQHTRACSQCSV